MSPSSGERTRWLAGAAGLGAVGALAGTTVTQAVTRRTTAVDHYAGEDFAMLKHDPGCLVTTPDGTVLAVREVGPPDAAVTVVFAHGFCLRKAAFHFQRVRLIQEWGTQVRMVFFDQRGHGQSDAPGPETYTVAQLGQDLEAVLKVMAPRGPVILVGHSMGGMAVLAHARQYPAQYGPRVVGAALLSSAAEGVTRSPVGEILQNPALEAVRFAARYAPGLLHRGRGAVRSVIGPILRAGSYGDEKISPSVVAFTEQMMHDTPIATVIGFLHALEVHDESAALRVLARIPTLVAAGDRDLLTPEENSVAMADAMPKSELLIVPGAGHLLQLESPDIINDALVRLVQRATPDRLVTLTRRLRGRV
ncbi:alpha/beta hydrolase [Mycolicibacillus trivialis]|uniref:Alpha/beta hydrolase n=1 Tax=Mycolicibacillus trivialis TaxID=1798 RepID=A0A1X2EE75_9MYCO|nr:alpha/beta hydrolase [Mycolicibacillus trivialis]ORW98945.1 alpha/beta hydrolase [Mycolicibacillus trivialis]